MTNAEKLREAARLIEEVKGTLNARETPCAGCGRVAKANWAQHGAAERLAGLPTKLRAIAGGGAIVETDEHKL